MFNVKVTNAMKTTLRKIARFSLALIIPVSFLVGCQEDLNEPIVAHPGGVRIPKGQTN